MTRGVPSQNESLLSDSLAAARRSHPRIRGKTKRRGVGLVLLVLPSMMLFASSAFGAPATVGLGSAASFSVLGGSTVTNTGPTTMFGDLGLSPGSSVTGAPVVLGQTHIDDAVAIEAKNALTTAYNDAAGRATEGSAGTDLAGQTFTAGVRTASNSLLLSSGSVILDAQGDPKRGVHLPDRLDAHHRLEHHRPADQRGSGVQCVLASRVLGDTRDRHALRRHGHGSGNDHRQHGGDDPRQTARADRRGKPGHEHDHAVQLRDRCD